MPFETLWNALPSRKGATIVPRRKKLYLGPGKTLVDGGRFDVADQEAPIATLPQAQFDIETIRKKVSDRIRPFDELAQLDDPDQFVKDLADECASALSLGLDYRTKGTRSKPQ